MRDIGATSFENYTQSTIDIINRVDVTSPEECCDSTKQILNKLCARQIYNVSIHMKLALVSGLLCFCVFYNVIVKV